MAWAEPTQDLSDDPAQNIPEQDTPTQSASTQNFPQIETVKEVSADAPAPLIILFVPRLSWGAFIEADPQTEALLAQSAIGNLSAPSSWPANTLLEDPRVGYYRLTANTTPNTAAAAAAATSIPGIPNAAPTNFSPWAAAINTFIARDLPPNAILVIVTAPVFNSGEASHDLTPVIIRTPSSNNASTSNASPPNPSNNNANTNAGAGAPTTGYLTSNSTHRLGLITAADLIALRDHLNEAPSSPSYSEATITSLVTNDNTTIRVQRLLHNTATIESMLATKTPANFAFLTLVFIAFALSALLLILGRKPQPSSRGSLIPAARILWLIVLAFPPATFLMYSILPLSPSPLTLTFALVIWVAILSFAALIIGWRTKWVNSLIALFSLSIIVIVIGQTIGGPLGSAGYLTYNITEGSRYYGMGNEQGAMLFGAWITLSGLLINRYPHARGIPAFKRWGYPLGSAILLFIATSPWFGASFGPLVWGFLGCFVSWWLFNGWRLRWWLTALVVLAAFGLALGVLYVDIAFNPVSHMYQVIPAMQDGPLEVIKSIASDVWSYSFSLIRDYVPVVVVIFLFFVFILLVILRVLQPGSYRQFWQRNTAFRAVYSVCFVLAAITFILEDSGVFTPAVLLIYPIACFVWLVCDLHSWHLRIFAQNGSPLTLRELQQRAQELLSPETLKNKDHAEKNRRSPKPPAHFRSSPALAATSSAATTDSVADSAFDSIDTSANAADSAPSSDSDTDAPSVGRATATMSAATLLSRITGFGKTWAMAFALGNTILTSAYTIANNLPNMLFELFAGGVLTTAFLPIYLAQLEKRGKDGASSYASNLLSIGAIVLGAIALLATIFAPQVVFTQSFLKSDDFDAQSAIFFFRFFAIQVLFYGVGAIINGLLNAHRSFLWPALGPVFNNIVVIITFFGYPFIRTFNEVGAMAWLAIGTTLGVVALFVVQIPALAKLKIPLRFHVNLKDPALKDTLKMALPAAVFIIMNLVAVSVMNAVALNATPKGPSTIQFAWLWYQLPYGVIAVALSTALLTEMSKASAAEDWEGFRNNVRLGLRNTIFLIIPLAAIIFTMSNQLVSLYNVGEFTYDDVLNVAKVVAMWCVALPFYASYMFIYRIFSSMRNLNRFIVIDAIGRVLLMLLYGFFTSGFGLFDGFGLVGIPLADACIYALLTGVMLYVLRRRIGTFGLTGIVFDGFKILVAALLAGILPFFFSYGSPDSGILLSLATVAVCGIFALIVYYLFCRLFRVPEVEMINNLAARLRSVFIRRKSGGKGRRT